MPCRTQRLLLFVEILNKDNEEKKEGHNIDDRLMRVDFLFFFSFFFLN